MKFKSVLSESDCLGSNSDFYTASCVKSGRVTIPAPRVVKITLDSTHIASAHLKIQSTLAVTRTRRHK